MSNMQKKRKRARGADPGLETRTADRCLVRQTWSRGMIFDSERRKSSRRKLTVQ